MTRAKRAPLSVQRYDELQPKVDFTMKGTKSSKEFSRMISPRFVIFVVNKDRSPFLDNT